MKLTEKKKKAILKLCREYAPAGQSSVFKNLGNDIIELIEEEPKREIPVLPGQTRIDEALDE